MLDQFVNTLHSTVELLKQLGPWGLFIHAFVDAVIFPIPAFVLQVSLSILDPSSAIWLATVGYIGCLLGTPAGYLIGQLAGKAVLNKTLKQEWIDTATKLFQRNGELAVLIGSFTPIPFKVFTILSGAFRFPLWKLISYAALGRAVKFYAVGALFYIYGRAAAGMAKDVSLYVFLAALPLLALYIYFKKRKAKKQQARVKTEQDNG